MRPVDFKLLSFDKEAEEIIAKFERIPVSRGQGPIDVVVRLGGERNPPTGIVRNPGHLTQEEAERLDQRIGEFLVSHSVELGLLSKQP